MHRPTKDAIALMSHGVLDDLDVVRAAIESRLHEERLNYAWAGIETFAAIALRVFSETNPSKLRDAMRIEEIKARMDGREVIE